MTNIHKIWSKSTKSDIEYSKYYIFLLVHHLSLVWCLLSLPDARAAAQLTCPKTPTNKGGVGLSDQTNPRTPHTTPIFSTEQSSTRSVTPPRAAEGAVDVAPPTTDAAEEGVDARLDRDVEEFPGSSRVTSTGSIKCTFFLNEELVPIKIERIPGHYRLFNLFFIICV